MLKRLTGALVFLFAAVLAAATPDLSIQDGIDRNDPNFVKASLVVIGQGNEFFGCAGHASLRLECPKFKLDCCFTGEGEPIRENLLRFVTGTLKMGIFMIPTPVFLENYRKLGRNAVQYPLDLPPDVKQRLWKNLDEEVKAGQSLKYDYIKNSCVQAVLRPLLEAVRPYEIKFPSPAEGRRICSRREALANSMDCSPWTRLFLHTIAGPEVDEMVGTTELLILPSDLVTFLREASIMGKPIIANPGEVLLPDQKSVRAFFIHPMVVAGVLLALSILGAFWPQKWIDCLLMGIQFLLGLLMMHLLFISSLPATTWNWLVVPFNLLPFIFWKWRRSWSLPFAFVLVVWEIGMLVAPHQMTDPVYLVVVPAYVVFYLRIAVKGKCGIFRNLLRKRCDNV